MIQIKERKRKYRNADRRKKAAFHGRGFQLDSKIYEKPLNLTMKIIRQNGKNRTAFLEKSEKPKEILRRRNYEFE